MGNQAEKPLEERHKMILNFWNKKVEKKACGVDLINEVAGRFSAIIDDLDEGVSDCRCEQSTIKSEIETLHQRDATLEASVLKASGIASNLRTLLGEN